jgi:hypothetical protein
LIRAWRQNNVAIELPESVKVARTPRRVMFEETSASRVGSAVEFRNFDATTVARVSKPTFTTIVLMVGPYVIVAEQRARVER